MGLQHSTGKDGQLKPGSSHIQSSRMDEEDSLLQKGIISPGCESLTDVGTELHRVEVRERLYPRGMEQLSGQQAQPPVPQLCHETASG